MKILPDSGRDRGGPEDSWLAELDAALSGRAGGPVADSWRNLRADVRALAPAMAPDFRRNLERRIAGRALGQPRPGPPRAGRRWPASPLRPGALRPGALRLGGLGTGGLRAGAALAAVAAVAVALLVVSPWRSANNRPPAQAISSPARSVSPPHSASHHSPDTAGAPAVTHGPETSPPTVAGGSAAARKGPAISRGEAASEGGPALEGEAAQQVSPAGPQRGPASAPGRLQALSASIGLTSTPARVQAVSDRVARVTVNEGGYVESSQVQVQQAGTSEADLILRLPSARLSAALGALGRLARVSSESQGLQDVTGSYEAARRTLEDTRAEGRGLQRSLERATTEAQVERLRRRLSRSRVAIDRASSQAKRISREARTATVEVTILGSRSAGAGSDGGKSSGLTVRRGLHDAGHALLVTLVVLLFAAAILVPVGLLAAALALGYGAWQRHRRERALDAR